MPAGGGRLIGLKKLVPLACVIRCPAFPSSKNGRINTNADGP